MPAPGPTGDAGTCYLCGAAVWLRQQAGFRTVRCERCGVTYVAPPVRVEEAFQLYREGTVFAGTTRTDVFRLVGRMLLERIGANGRLLDAGCGAGGFLSIAHEFGWDAQGIDINVAAVEEARRRGFSAEVGRIEEIDPSTRQFDAIVMMNALEYFNDPVGAVSAAFALLRPGGVLAVEMPNAAYHRVQTSIAHLLRLPSERFMEVAPTAERRLFAFSPRSLELLLRRAGFSEIELRPSAPRHHGGVAQRLVRQSIFVAAGIFHALSRRRVIAPAMVAAGVKRVAARQ